jgi:hypothetical protein
MYSPGQIAGGAFLGGPVGALYFLRANFIAMGNARLAATTLLYGIPFVVAIFGLDHFIRVDWGTKNPELLEQFKQAFALLTHP